MSSQQQYIYEFGPYRLDIEKHLLLRGDEPVSLTPKAFEILHMLVRNNRRLVEKAELVKTIWPDTIVGDATLAQNVSTLRKALGDSEEGGPYIETVPRCGYRFLGTVRQWLPNESPQITTKEDATARDATKAQDSNRELKAHLSLAVLPFASRDPLGSDLSDKITELVINTLSRFPRVRVVARSTVFQYKNKHLTPQEIGRELGVPLVLMGKVLEAHDILSIQVELVDVADGTQIWGELFDRKFSDLDLTQDQIGNEICKKLNLELSREERKQLRKPSYGKARGFPDGT